MTTIAYKDGVMAADTLAVKGNLKQGGLKKIYRVGECLVGFAGDVCDIPVLLDWLNHNVVTHPHLDWFTPPEGFPEDTDTTVLIVSPDGYISELEHLGRISSVSGKMHAVGTGAQFALGAMAQGADACRGVEIAMTFDAYTGGHVVHHRVKKKINIASGG